MMNPLFEKFAGALIRWALTLIGGWLIKQGILNADDVEKMILAVITVAVPLCWSIWAKWREQRKLATAAGMPKATLDEVNEKIKSGGAASALTPTDEVPLVKK